MTTTQDYGPVELLTVGFTTEAPPAPVIDAILALAAEETVSLLDLIVVSRGEDGSVAVVELEEHDSDPLRELELALVGLVAEEDITVIAESLPPGSSALVAAVELSWARNLMSAIATADAVVLSQDRIPASVIAESAIALQKTLG
ncbi:hypothetical protein EV379_3066 [Microterricola gilva]|uniref:DUF1269 domain-containing protein n=1 Tax=Microterricola gilva TaxID=393267 RepID=A0A4Q8APT1_9MICO|nr:DUF6325 family protein [Microterricola gilva]RZU66700.1 hypothetical protein EV379_3066 [Microterricola gilva]